MFKFGLMIRGQHKPGEDMRLRHADDLALVRRAEQLGFDCVGKASHYSSPPNCACSAASSCCRCISRSISPNSSPHWM
jgi:alkanesulfonate monooxygenase SsuD/methylene tetrahydromethanopterin reductase-like flavin-dependent oxidoreductase (luciferase family)